MVTQLRPLTYDDLQDMPDDGQRYEIIGGELVVTPAPTSGHQRVLLRLIRLLDDYAREFAAGELFLAPFDVRLGHFDAVQPDLIFISAARSRIPDEANAIDYPPHLVVEVLSSSSRITDLVRKMALYARSCIPEYWIADPDRRTLTINVLEGEEYRAIDPDNEGFLSSRVLPGLHVDLVAVFAGLV